MTSDVFGVFLTYLPTLGSWIEVPVCFIQDFCYFKRERQFGLFSFEITKLLNKTHRDFYYSLEYLNQILYYISLFSKIRCSLTYLPTQKSDVICECSHRKRRISCWKSCAEELVRKKQAHISSQSVGTLWPHKNLWKVHLSRPEKNKLITPRFHEKNCVAFARAQTDDLSGNGSQLYKQF